MKQITISLNLPDWQKLANENTQKDLEYRTILSGARSLQETIRQSLISNVPKATQSNPKYTDTMADAIMISKANLTNGERVVHALGSRAKGSGTYRARFFNNMTKKRYQKTWKGKKLKKKRYVGVVGGTFFWSKGINQGKSLMQEIMLRYAQRYIQNKINESIK